MNEPRRIIVITDPMAAEVQKAFVQWLTSLGAGWAHWVAGGWLIAPAHEGAPSVQDITDKMKEFTPPPPHLVFEVERLIGWQGSLLIPQVEPAQKWLRTQWNIPIA
jgi:hypothetical protein